MKKVKNKIVIIILKIVLSIIIVYNVCFFINTTITKKDYFSIFGKSFFYVNTKTMEPDLKKYNFIIVKENKNEYEDNDIIIYETSNQIKIGKIIENKIENDKKYYIVKANSNYYPETIKTSQIIGKKILKLPLLGLILKILQTKVVTIIIGFSLIFFFIYNRYKYLKGLERRRKKKRKNDNYWNE